MVFTGNLSMRSFIFAGCMLAAGWCVPTGVPGQATAGPALADPVEKPWSFVAPSRPEVPLIVAPWVRNPIDAFTLAAMRKEKVAPAAGADRQTLIRRLTFDLTGLPPTPADVAAFLADQSPTAYEALVDRLLASPRYGEHWAMYWLDLVRYADSEGFKHDEFRPLAWRYRDYVIAAFNADKPYNRFIQEQLAGDELFPGDSTALVATGFNRNYPDESNAKDLDLRRQEILNDMTDTTGLVFLGLTVGCARCHDHKYDPILQTDYYRLQAFFAAFRPFDERVVNSPAEVLEYQTKMKAWEEATAEVQHRLLEVEQPYRQKIITTNKVKYGQHLQEAFDTPAARRSPLQQQLGEMLAKQLQVDRGAMTKSMKSDVKKNWEELDKELANFAHLKPPPLARAMSLTDVGPVAPGTHVLFRGDYKKKGAAVEPGFPAIWDGSPARIVPPAAVSGQSTGRRAALAQWLTRPDHPLTARVIVNRLWQHHFGRGIVGTPSDFGILGEPPTNQDLLDWLATEFVAKGWSLKQMHRLMVNSATYRQSAIPDPSAAKLDPNNQLFSRMHRRRLEGEVLRDAMLSASGLLNLKAGGPSVAPELPADLEVPRGGWKVTADPLEHNRRSVYIFAKRNLRYPLFSAFDAPEGNESCAVRNQSTNAPQALMLMNGKLALDLSKAFAGRVLRESQPDAAARVATAYRISLGREPAASEVKLALAFLASQTDSARARLGQEQSVMLPADLPPDSDHAAAAALVDFCHVLLNLNEFAFVD
jgi:hypothetical protein